MTRMTVLILFCLSMLLAAGQRFSQNKTKSEMESLNVTDIMINFNEKVHVPITGPPEYYYYINVVRPTVY